MAALNLLDKVDLINKKKCLNWLLQRQIVSDDNIAGFQGRVNKPADSCYSFWIGASIDVFD